MSIEPPDPFGPTSRPTWIQRVRSTTVDLAPLRESRDFRLLWAGNSISYIGSEMQFVAIPFQIFQLTGSSLAVGLIGLVELIPIVVFSLIGGAISDAIDRRKLLLATEIGGIVTALVLAWNATTESPLLWLIYVMAFIEAALFALGSPALRSSTPLLIRKEKLTAAAAVTTLSRDLSAVVGPAVGGLLIAGVGLRAAFLINAATFLASLAAAYAMSPIPPSPDAERASMRTLLDGLRYLKGRKVLQGAFLVDINAMVFGMPMALFPAIAERFGGPGVLGILYSAASAGALLSSIFSGWTGRIYRQGRAVYFAVIGWGAGLIVFGLAEHLWLALLALAFAGAADNVSAIFRSAIVQTATPPHMIGRLSGVELGVVASGPALGDLEAGVLAALTNVRFSVVFGGFACIAGVGLMALLLPEFARYDSRDPSP